MLPDIAAPKSPPEQSQTLDRGLTVLRELSAAGPDGLSVSALAGRLSVGRPVVYRLVATLMAHELVRRDSDGTVRLGMGLLGLARAAAPALLGTARPVLRRLADAAGATAHLTVADGDEATAVEVVEPNWTDYHVGYRVGSRHPLARGAAGRAILAGRRGEAGVVTSIGELQSGATGVAAPVLGVPGLAASIGVVAVGALDLRAVSPLVTAAAAELTDLLR